MKHHVASHEEWFAASKELLAKEKELTRMRDELSRIRRALPCEIQGLPRRARWVVHHPHAATERRPAGVH